MLGALDPDLYALTAAHVVAIIGYIGGLCVVVKQSFIDPCTRAKFTSACLCVSLLLQCTVNLMGLLLIGIATTEWNYESVVNFAYTYLLWMVPSALSIIAYSIVVPAFLGLIEGSFASRKRYNLVFKMGLGYCLFVIVVAVSIEVALLVQTLSFTGSEDPTYDTYPLDTISR
ncbi:hypothetical protein KIPB_010931 [Kipferlia bialata]|uniref:Uncharacterized protein n=1 Tax=Kipferlia bialata TaxID=797122 RepID=A0A9K3GLX4_9EUKA|nr:hypothetical protein KIPB_010931 [Kipferlia bialata]|eukprot:g10931.t1